MMTPVTMRFFYNIRVHLKINIENFLRIIRDKNEENYFESMYNKGGKL